MVKFYLLTGLNILNRFKIYNTNILAPTAPPRHLAECSNQMGEASYHCPSLGSRCLCYSSPLGDVQLIHQTNWIPCMSTGCTGWTKDTSMIHDWQTPHTRKKLHTATGTYAHLRKTGSTPTGSMLEDKPARLSI